MKSFKSLALVFAAAIVSLGAIAQTVPTTTAAVKQDAKAGAAAAKPAATNAAKTEVKKDAKKVEDSKKGQAVKSDVNKDAKKVGATAPVIK